MVQCGAKRSFDSEVLGWSFMVQKVVDVIFHIISHFNYYFSSYFLFTEQIEMGNMSALKPR